MFNVFSRDPETLVRPHLHLCQAHVGLSTSSFQGYHPVSALSGHPGLPAGCVQHVAGGKWGTRQPCPVRPAGKQENMVMSKARGAEFLLQTHMPGSLRGPAQARAISLVPRAQDGPDSVLRVHMAPWAF